MSNMKFKKDDKVRVVADEKRLKELSINLNIAEWIGFIHYVGEACYEVTFGLRTWCFEEQDLELVYTAVPVEPDRTDHPDGELEVTPAPIRTFNTGATRDTAEGKLDYVKALSPIVLRRYVQYLNKHRLQSDGSYRDFDNWKQGIPQDTYLSSLGRHFIDTWLLSEGHSAEDNHGPIEEEDTLCAIMFNAMGKLHEVLKAEMDNVAR